MISPQLLKEASHGLAITEQPYRDLAARLGISEEEALSQIRTLLEKGVIRRWGAVLNHRQMGFTSNAMSVWNIPDAEVSSIGRRMREYPFVTLCYRRRRQPPKWNFNLYCMVHGRDRSLVEEQIRQLNRELELTRFDHQVLFSRRCFRQTGARHFGPTFQEVDRILMNRLQEGLPVTERPFEKIAQELGISEEAIVSRIQDWLKDSTASRFGPLFNVEKFGGVFTLVAMEVPRERFEEVIEIVNRFPEVAHNYEREHRWNMWFVVATESQTETDSVLQEIERQTGLPTFSMPKLEEYFLDLRFST